MTADSSSSPWWRRPQWQGTLGGILMIVLGLVVTGGDWSGDFFRAVVTGALLCPVLAGRTARQHQTVVDACRLDAPDQQAAAIRASARGRVPRDPVLREAAYRVAVQRHQDLCRQRWAAVVLVAITALPLYLAFTDSPLWWLFVAVLLSIPAGLLWLCMHTASRAELLGRQVDEESG